MIIQLLSLSRHRTCVKVVHMSGYESPRRRRGRARRARPARLAPRSDTVLARSQGRGRLHGAMHKQYASARFAGSARRTPSTASQCGRGASADTRRPSRQARRTGIKRAKGWVGVLDIVCVFCLPSPARSSLPVRRHEVRCCFRRGCRARDGRYRKPRPRERGQAAPHLYSVRHPAARPAPVRREDADAAFEARTSRSACRPSSNGAVANVSRQMLAERVVMLTYSLAARYNLVCMRSPARLQRQS